MPVIKEFESRVADIQCLEALIAEHGDKPSIKKQLDLELRKIRMGDKAEKNAGYLLGSIYRERKDAYLINGLRLEIEGDVAQIDHMTLNSYGVVITKLISKFLHHLSNLKGMKEWFAEH